MTKESPSTKDLIIEKASEMFATLGFKGTSIRELAQACDVNIAAINYHFGSKQGLYLEVSNRTYDWLANGLKENCETAKDLETFVVKCFEFMVTKPEAVCSSIRLILTDGIVDSDQEGGVCHKGNQGPPGSEYFASMIEKEFNESLDLETVDFMVKSFFSQVIHFAMIYSSPRYTEFLKKSKGITKKRIGEHLRHHVRAIVAYVNTNKKLTL